MRVQLGLGNQPVHSEGDQSWDFFGRNDAKTETPVLWPPHSSCGKLIHFVSDVFLVEKQFSFKDKEYNRSGFQSKCLGKQTGDPGQVTQVL